MDMQHQEGCSGAKNQTKALTRTVVKFALPYERMSPSTTNSLEAFRLSHPLRPAYRGDTVSYSPSGQRYMKTCWGPMATSERYVRSIEGLISGASMFGSLKVFLMTFGRNISHCLC